MSNKIKISATSKIEFEAIEAAIQKLPKSVQEQIESVEKQMLGTLRFQFLKKFKNPFNVRFPKEDLLEIIVKEKLIICENKGYRFVMEKEPNQNIKIFLI